MIRREYDAALINRVSNMPGVREGVCYKPDDMDWSPAFPARTTGIAVLSNGEDACAVFVPTGPRVFQSHTLFGPTCRGKRAIETGKAMLAWMKPHADVIWGATPMKNCAARWFNRQLGAMPIRRDHFEAEGEVEIFTLRLD
jgi:hypothetical protein